MVEGFILGYTCHTCDIPTTPDGTIFHNGWQLRGSPSTRPLDTFFIESDIITKGNTSVSGSDIEAKILWYFTINCFVCVKALGHIKIPQISVWSIFCCVICYVRFMLFINKETSFIKFLTCLTRDETIPAVNHDSLL